MDSPSLSKRYTPGAFEEKWYTHWLQKGYFIAYQDPKLKRFSIVIPPPNVTGKLHMGHALVNTLQDIMVRYKRMDGYNTLWLPGTDHAGIATQMVVERELLKEGKTRHIIGREKFLQIMWEWKETYKSNIKKQLMLLGCSCDWSRERFTLDEGLSRAVRHVFTKLWRDQLLYQDYRIVHWCPRCQTALSDLEVEYRDIRGKLYTIAYPFLDREGYIPVATTRPETLLGDTAVAVHPEDQRYQRYIGKTLRLPLLHRPIPVIADNMVDPTFGTGAVKITPAHDPNDFEVARRQELPAIQVMDEKGVCNDQAGPYKGLDRFEARRAVLKDLKDQGLLLKVEDHRHHVGHCQRCETMIEPYYSRQWFVRMQPLAEPALRVVKEGEIKFVPEHWVKTYFDWMENIHDWCISRQIWWGHRIPAFTCLDCGKITVQEEDPLSCPHCGATRLRQDEDVLDTWFSSALWPFSTLGWPDQTKDLAIFYPTDCLITGFDILFFWVARMIMMGLYCTRQVPFREVYLNALVRDAQGQKMSKSRGNVLEPEAMIQRYGVDALRFTLSILASPGRDIPLAPERMEGYRAFINKFWNATRFALMKAPKRMVYGKPPTLFLNRWILTELRDLIQKVRQNLDQYRFDQAAHHLYHFTWHVFCDWYIEGVKPYLANPETSKAQECTATLYDVLDGLMRLLHPFMPFVTEEIYQKLYPAHESIVKAPFPRIEDYPKDEEALKWFGYLKEIVMRARSFRVAAGLPPTFPLHLTLASHEASPMLLKSSALFKQLGTLTEVKTSPSLEGFKDHVEDLAFSLHIPQEAYTDELFEKLQKELEKSQSRLANIEKRLANPAFQSNAPPEVVDEHKLQREKLLERIHLLEQNLPR